MNKDENKAVMSRNFLLRQKKFNNNTTSQQLSHDIYNHHISDKDLFNIVNSKSKLKQLSGQDTEKESNNKSNILNQNYKPIIIPQLEIYDADSSKRYFALNSFVQK